MAAAVATESCSGRVWSPRTASLRRLRGAHARRAAAADDPRGSDRRETAHNPGSRPIPWFPTLLGHQFQFEPLMNFSPGRRNTPSYSIVKIFAAPTPVRLI